MKNRIKYIIGLAALGLCAFAFTSARANLTITIYPGYTFGPGERPTTDTLNRLGQPTGILAGTIDGSTGLSAGSVNGTLLAESVVDGLTTAFDGSSPPAITVLSTGLVDLHGGIWSSNNFLYLAIDPNYFALSTNSPSGQTNGATTNWLTLKPQSLADTNVAVNARIQVTKHAARAGTLYSGGPYVTDTNDIVPTNVVETFLGPGLAINMQTNTYAITNGASVTQKTNVTAALVLTTATNFVSQLFTVPAAGVGGVVTTNTLHNLATGTNAPSRVRWVLVCQTANLGYAPGDELGIENFQTTAGAGPFVFNGGASSNMVFLVQNGGGTVQMLNKTTFSQASVTLSNWKARCYAAP